MASGFPRYCVPVWVLVLVRMRFGRRRVREASSSGGIEGVMFGGVPCGCDGHFAVPSPARAPSGRLHARPPGEVCEREVWVLLASTCVLSCARVLCVAIVGTMSLLPIGSSRRSRSSRRAAEDALADGSRPSRHATEDMLADHDEDIYSGRAGTHARMTIYEAILRISPPVSSSHTHAHCSSSPRPAVLDGMLSRSPLFGDALIRRILWTTNLIWVREV